MAPSRDELAQLIFEKTRVPFSLPRAGLRMATWEEIQGSEAANCYFRAAQAILDRFAVA